MFHWQDGDDYAVLLSTEARSAYLEATQDPAEAMLFGINTGSPDKRDIVVEQHLRIQRSENPEAFKDAYLFRSAWGLAGCVTFALLMDGYRRLFNNADSNFVDLFDRFESVPGAMMQLDQFLSGIDVIDVGLFHFEKRFLLKDRRHQCGSLGFTPADVDHVFGTSRRFIVMTKGQKIVFGEDGVHCATRSVAQLQMEAHA